MHDIDQEALHVENFLSRSGTKRFFFCLEMSRPGLLN